MNSCTLVNMIMSQTGDTLSGASCSNRFDTAAFANGFLFTHFVNVMQFPAISLSKRHLAAITTYQEWSKHCILWNVKCMDQKKAQDVDGKYLFSWELLLCGGVYLSLSGTLSITETCSFNSAEVELLSTKHTQRSECGKRAQEKTFLEGKCQAKQEVAMWSPWHQKIALKQRLIAEVPSRMFVFNRITAKCR